MSEPEHQEIVTYTVKDRAGMIRDRGAPLERARAVAQRLAEQEWALCAPLTIERVTYTSVTQREIVETHGEAP
jgi:hypothetical protein